MTKYFAKKPDHKGNIDFTPEENGTWKILFERQMQTVQNRACDEYMQGLQRLNLPHNYVPQCSEVSKILQKSTGWSVVPVSAIIPLKTFFELLSKRQFPAASFIRVRDELDYLPEPDIFHEFFGHCPMLTWKPYANFIEQFAKIALTTDEKVQSLLGRLFWFTIEFGLIESTNGRRIYGAGILSSHTETQSSLEGNDHQCLPFSMIDTLKTEYRYDMIQKLYFALTDFSQLFSLDLNEMIKIAKHIAEHPFHEKDFVIC